MKDSNDIVFDCRWSDKLNDKFVNDFIDVERQVFNNNYSHQYFQKKYVDNIYGRSVVEVVYIDGRPSAARGLWRNDIDGKEAYQPGDTCVLENCRGKGVFSEMTKRAIALLPSSSLIYNFPNQKSYHGYIKMGWMLLHEYGVRLFTPKRYFREHPILMDEEYAKWWVIGNKDLRYIKRGNYYFLVKDDHRPLLSHIVASVTKDIALSFPKSSFRFFFYKSEIETFYNRKYLKGHVVCLNTDIGYIPTWKIDAL